MSDDAPIHRESFDEPLRSARSLVAELTRSAALERGDTDEAMRQLTEASALALGLDRASVWCLNAARTALVCVDLFERSAGRHGRGASIDASNAPRYFEALSKERTIAARDVRTDPRTVELSGSGAALDAPIFLDGRLCGVVRHELVGAPREWKPWEELIAGTFADFAAMVFGTTRRAEQARALESMERNRETLEVLFDAAPVPFVLVGRADGVIRACNQRAAQMLEGTQEEIVGLTASEFCADYGARRAFFSTLLRTGRVDGLTTELHTLSGRPFWAQLNAHRLDLAGEQVFMLGFADLTEQRLAEGRLLELATTDPLTGVLNRRRFYEIAEEEVSRAARYARPLALAILDLDHFKAVNDGFGHLVGDEALRCVARAIRSELRRQDQACRYGGEEFVVLLPETTLEGARQVVERMHEAVSAICITTEAGDVHVTLSAGVVALRAEESFDMMLHRADEALYAAKEAGRDRVIAVS